MIRCSECKHLKTLLVMHKVFRYCSLSPQLKIWVKIPVGHPRWCPKRKEEKQNVKKD